MDPREAQSSQNQDQARRRREEAARRQQLQLRQQAAKIEEQRKLAARQKSAASSAQPGSARRAPSAASAQASASGWTKVSEVVVDTAQTPATPTPPKPKSVVSAPKSPPPAPKPKPAPVVVPPLTDDVAVAPQPSEAEARAEMAAFAHEDIKPEAALPLTPPALIDELPEIEITPAEVEMPELRLVDPKAPATPSPVEETPAPLVVELPATDPATADIGHAEFPVLKMAEQPDLYCPKCQSLIPENSHGSFYTACPRCGEIIKMK